MPDGTLPAADANRADASAPSSRAQPPPRPAEPGAGAARHPLRDVIDTLDRARPAIAEADPALDREIHRLRDRAEKPGQLDHAGFRTRVAYALTDFEKLAGPVPSVPAALREELTGLAGTVPGLRNERLQELMRATPSMQDQHLVRDIRTVAASVAQLGQAQDTSSVRSFVETLENKVRLSSGAGPAASVATVGTSPRSDEAVQARPTTSERTMQPSGDAVPRAHAAVSPGGQPAGQPPADNSIQARPGFNGPASAQHQATFSDQHPQRHQQGASPPDAPYVRGPGALANIMAAMTRPPSATTPPWEGPPTPMADRLGRFQQRMQENREEQGFQGAERSGRAAADALQGFSNGPGAGILTKIRDAAKSDPSGMQGVMAEMREGGRYADLRSQFNSALVAEQGFAAAYDRAAGALTRYGKDRAAVDQVASARPDAASITARFAKTDAQIGEAAGATPGKKDAKSLAEELGDKAAELVHRAVKAVKAALGRVANPEMRPSAGPSASP